jgi:hypothetical protein
MIFAYMNGSLNKFSFNEIYEYIPTRLFKDLVEDITTGILVWVGHVIKMDQTQRRL